MPNPVTGKVGLKELPRSEYGAGFAIQAADMDVNIISGTIIPTAGIIPDKLGLPVRNQSGSSIPAGSLVYLSGWDNVNGLALISLASAAAVATRASWVTIAAIPNNSNGTVGRHFSFTGQNTVAAAQGDPVWLGLTPGGYSLTSVVAGSTVYQIVGRVATVSATGIVDFDLLSGDTFYANDRLQTDMPAIGTAAGAYWSYIIVPAPMTILGARSVWPASLAISGTNYVTFSITNLQSGAGAIAVLNTTSPNNSTFTGGLAITQDTAYPLTLSGTPANLVVAGGDLLKVIATVTGTLGSAIPIGGVISLATTRN